jgi:glycosyltransferase involved in cell wall biosynthesis
MPPADVAQKRPLVTIAMPAWKAEPWIGEAVDAALAQTERDAEVIVVDDASPDRTADVVRERAARDPRLALHVNERNLGIGANWNRALSLARGEFVLLTHHDERMRPRMVERLVGALRARPEAVLVMGNQVEIDAAGRETGRRVWEPPAEQDALIAPFDFLKMAIESRKPRFTTSTCMARKAMWDAVGPFDERFVYALDLVQWTRFALRGPIAYVHEVILENREWPGRGTHALRSLATSVEAVAARAMAYEAAAAGGALSAGERAALARALGAYVAREARRLSRHDRGAAALALGVIRRHHAPSLVRGNALAAALRVAVARATGGKPPGPAAAAAAALIGRLS